MNTKKLKKCWAILPITVIFLGNSLDGVQACPAGYSLVPKNLRYVEEDFCVAKFEMRKGAKGLPVSSPKGLPWNLSRKDAILACQRLGEKYDLISNGEWQTIARNIEKTHVNWNSRIIGVGSLSRGLSGVDKPKYMPWPKSIIDILDPWDQVAYTAQLGRPSYFSEKRYQVVIQKRLFVLSSGHIVWDFAGNVWEWVKDDNGFRYGKNSFISKITNYTHNELFTLDRGVKRNAKEQFGPDGDYSRVARGDMIGLGWASFDRSSPAILRGGDWSDKEVAGIFSVAMNHPPWEVSNDVGFRCTVSND